MDILKILLIILLFVYPIAELGKFQMGALSFTVNDLLISSVLLVWLFKERRNLKKLKSNLKKPIILFAGISTISLLLNISWLNFSDILISFLYIIRWLAYASIYFALMSQEKKFLDRYKLLMIIPISLFLLFGYMQYVFYQDLRNLYYLGWDEHLYRLFSTFLDPNFAGAFFVLTFIYLLFLCISNYKKKYFLIFLSFLSVANLFAIYLTYSRSALIMLFTSLFVFLILQNKKKVFMASVGILFILIFISPKAFQTEGTNLLRIASVESRIESAKVAIDIFSKNPVFGVGFNAYRFAQYKYGYLKGESWVSTHSGAGTDNSYLFILATTGIVGLLGYLFLIYKMIRISLKKNNMLSKVLLASLIGVLVNSFFINSLFYVYIMQWIWIMMALTENN